MYLTFKKASIIVMILTFCGCSDYTAKMRESVWSFKQKYISIAKQNRINTIYSDRSIKINKSSKERSINNYTDSKQYKKSNSEFTYMDKNFVKEQSLFDEALAFCETAQIFWQKGELDNALEALDEAYYLILSVNTDYHFKLAQQRDDLRFSISKRILEIYASRNIVVNGNHNAIPRDINHHVEKEIIRFTNGSEKKFFIESYKKSGKYLPMIIKKLKKAGIPEELAWIPMVESGFKVKAMSKARALGLWQFIPSTGYKFGLKRDKYVDERIDFVKSTDAAVAYLKELHNIFGDWSTVLAAYNCGEGRVLRLIRTQNINYLDNFWDLYGRLPFETARYVPRFLATLHIVENPDKYGLNKITPDNEFKYVNVHVQKQVNLKDIACKIKIPLKTLMELNPELRYLILPNRRYSLRVPIEKDKTLTRIIHKIPISKLPQTTYSCHKIELGESLSIIAKKYCTTVEKIMKENCLTQSNYIVVGKKLKIPQRNYEQTKSENYNQNDFTYLQHSVKRGDSLWIIARMYNSTTKKIQEINTLTGTTLYIGQILKIPISIKKNTISEKYKIYHVIKGDSPFSIAKNHNMLLERFLSINNLTPRSKIYPNQKLIVE